MIKKYMHEIQTILNIFCYVANALTHNNWGKTVKETLLFENRELDKKKFLLLINSFNLMK